MVRSMTGYGRAAELYEGRQITVELRSVNNRYLDCGVKLPRGFSFAEDAMKQLVKRYTTRGKVDVFVTVSTLQSEDLSITLNRPALEGYLAAMRQIAAEYDVLDDVSVSTLSRLPEVFALNRREEDENALLAVLLSVEEVALKAFNTMRETEGAALADDLRSRADTVEALVAEVEARSPERVAAYRERLYAKLQEVLASTSIDEARILTEAALFADRVAVDEETVRLRSHLMQLRGMLASEEPIGRKLDFLMQEMNREANTIGSKGNDLEIARTVVAIKAELEKIREQIQNVE